MFISSASNPLEKSESAMHSSANHQFTGKPSVLVIEPSKSRVDFNLIDLWNYRDLLYILTTRDIKVRYKQTVLGAAWAILQPLLTMVVFTIFFGGLAGVPSDGVPYPIFAFAGLLLWTFFSNALTTSGNSLVGKANLITKVYFPRIIIPIAAVAAGLLDLAINFGLLVVLMIYYGVNFSTNLLMLARHHAVDRSSRRRNRNVDEHTQHQIPRYSLCSAVYDSNRNVRLGSYLSGQPRAA